MTDVSTRDRSRRAPVAFSPRSLRALALRSAALPAAALLLVGGGFAAVAVAAPAPTTANPAETADGAPTVLASLLDHYEAVRRALSQDTMDSVPRHAGAVVDLVEGLRDDWDAARAGARPGTEDLVQAQLPALAAAGRALGAADGLAAARDAFYELSLPFVRLRGALDRGAAVVAYCPMAERSWLQPDGELGNPYYGRSMLRCGEILDG